MKNVAMSHVGNRFGLLPWKGTQILIHTCGIFEFQTSGGSRNSHTKSLVSANLEYFTSLVMLVISS